MIRKPFRRLIYFLAGAAATAGCMAVAQSGVYTDPAAAGPDFVVQGEYAGSAAGPGGAAPLAAQVIALGSGSFQAVFLSGGLPGDGWDRKTPVRVEGKTEGATAVFGGPGGWGGKIEKDVFRGTTGNGAAFELKKVHRKSPTEGLKPPAGAVVLFDGTSADRWVNGKMTPDGLLQAGCRTKEQFGDLTLHLEFRTPFKPAARGQARGNSGVYLRDRYEVQILDSFGLEGKNNECGGLYSLRAPDVNMCYPPLSWQTYDIDFQAARFDASGNKLENAVMTVRHNGVLIHDRVEVSAGTNRRRRDEPASVRGSISLQNHGNPVVFRNIWVVERPAG